MVAKLARALVPVTALLAPATQGQGGLPDRLYMGQQWLSIENAVAEAARE